MNVFYFTSDLFVSVAAVSIVSLMENNRDFVKIHFYIVDDGISDEKKEKLTGLIRDYGREVSFIEAPDPSEALRFPFKSRYQMGHSYVRMCIGSLLPESVERVLCLDSDTLVMGSLRGLWDLDIGNNILAGVTDCMNLSAYNRQFGLTGDEFYCNAGMFLVDLKKWRENHIEDEICEVIQSHNGNVFFFEQTLMNYACRGRIYQLHPRYNSYTLLYAFTYENLLRWRNPTVFYTKAETDEAKNSPVIIHFTRNFYMLSRPWVKGCDHPMTVEYLKYKAMTPWQELEEDNRSVKKKGIYTMVHTLPQGLLARVAGVIYNSIRPKMWWKNE